MNYKLTFDDVLKKAFCEYADENFKAEPDDLIIYPIPKKELAFARSVDKMRKKSKRPMWKTYLQRAAVIMLVCATVFCALLSTSVEVRAAIGEAFSAWFEKYVKVFFTEEEKTYGDEIYEYSISYIPDGYSLYEKHEESKKRTFSYSNGSDNIHIEIAFSDYAEVSADSSLHGYEELWFNSHSAYLLKSKDGTSNAIIFGDSNITVRIEASISREALILVAKGINRYEFAMLGHVRDESYELSKNHLFTYKNYTTLLQTFSEFEIPVEISYNYPKNWSDPSSNLFFDHTRPLYENEVPPFEHDNIRRCMAGSTTVLRVDKDYVLGENVFFDYGNFVRYYEASDYTIGRYVTKKGYECVTLHKSYEHRGIAELSVRAYVRITPEYIIQLDIQENHKYGGRILDILDSLSYIQN